MIARASSLLVSRVWKIQGVDWTEPIGLKISASCSGYVEFCHNASWNNSVYMCSSSYSSIIFGINDFCFGIENWIRYRRSCHSSFHFINNLWLRALLRSLTVSWYFTFTIVPEPSQLNINASPVANISGGTNPNTVLVVQNIATIPTDSWPLSYFFSCCTFLLICSLWPYFFFYFFCQGHVSHS